LFRERFKGLDLIDVLFAGIHQQPSEKGDKTLAKKALQQESA